MNKNIVEWSENVTPEIVTFFNRLYKNYTEIVTGKPMDKEDFNGRLYMYLFYRMYIDEIEAGNITEIENLPIVEAITNCLECSEKIHLKEIIY